MCEDSFIPGADDDINLDDIIPTDSVIITWPLQKDISIPDDDIIYEEVVDDVTTLFDEHGRPYTSFHTTDRDGRPMTVRLLTAPIIPSSTAYRQTVFLIRFNILEIGKGKHGSLIRARFRRGKGSR